MRISKFKIEKELSEKVGLKAIDLTKKELGEVVALVGENGAGKSRILKFVQDYFDRVNEDNIKNGHLRFWPEDLNNQFGDRFGNKTSIWKGFEIDSIGSMNTIVSLLSEFGKNYIKVIDNDSLKIVKQTIENGFTFEDLIKTPYSLLQKNAKNGINEFTNLNSMQTIDYLIKLTTSVAIDKFNQMIERENSQLDNKLEEAESIKRFSIFQKYVNSFLGKAFSFKNKKTVDRIDIQLLFNNKEFDLNLFSPGQKTLFAYVMLFYYLELNSNTNFDESILILDEPEKHLHPKSQISLLNKLRELVKERGQLWIATHSVDIISHLSIEEIVMVENDGIVLPSVNTPQKTLVSLMGLEGHIETVGQFINTVNDWTYTNFIIQCFKEPEVILGNSINDPQYLIFKEFVMGESVKNVLDYGAGKGRLGYTIYEDEELRGKINYYAYQRETDIQEELKKVPILHKIFNENISLTENMFDIVVMANVLHEINPFEWEKVFDDLKYSIKPNGYLVVIEDKLLPKGEKANYYGYLNLDVQQFRTLFSDELITLELKDEKYKNRIAFIAINKFDVTKDKIIATLENLSIATYNNIKKIRDKESVTPNESRKYANLTQTYINCMIALDDFMNKEYRYVKKTVRYRDKTSIIETEELSKDAIPVFDEDNIRNLAKNNADKKGIQISRIAKEVNRQSSEVLEYLKRIGVEVSGVMSKVDGEVYLSVLDHFKIDIAETELHKQKLYEFKRKHKGVEIGEIEELYKKVQQDKVNFENDVNSKINNNNFYLNREIEYLKHQFEKNYISKQNKKT